MIRDYLGMAQMKKMVRDSKPLQLSRVESLQPVAHRRHRDCLRVNRRCARENRLCSTAQHQKLVRLRSRTSKVRVGLVPMTMSVSVCEQPQRRQQHHIAVKCPVHDDVTTTAVVAAAVGEVVKMPHEGCVEVNLE